MTDYELLIAFNEMAINAQDSYMNFVSVVFGFIVAGYLVADKLSGKMVILMIILFTVVAFQESLAAIFFLQDQFGLIPEMQTREALQFHGSNRTSANFSDLFIVMFMGTQILAYVGSIIFFSTKGVKGSCEDPLMALSCLSLRGKLPVFNIRSTTVSRHS